MAKIQAEVRDRSTIEYDRDIARDQLHVANARLTDCEARLAACNASIDRLKQMMEMARELDEARPQSEPPPQAAPAPVITQPAYTPPPRQGAAVRPSKATKKDIQPAKRRGRPPGRPRKQPEPMHEEATNAGQQWGGKSIAEAAAE